MIETFLVSQYSKIRTVYSIADGERFRAGEIIRTEIVSGQNFSPLGENEASLSGRYGWIDYYVVDGVVTPRPEFVLNKTTITANDIDEAVILDVPDPITVWLDNVETEITGGEIRLSSAVEWSCSLIIDHWPYKKFEATLEFV